MATLEGALQLRGSLGNLSFYPHKNGSNIARRKGGPSKEKVLTDGSFERTRENFADFGSVSRVASTVRYAMAPYMEYMSDGSYFNRLVGLLKMVSKTDRDHRRGQKQAFCGNIHLLEDFQWNSKLAFGEAVQADCYQRIDAATGRLSLEIASFIPLAQIKAPAGATHFQIVARGNTVYENKQRGSISMTATPLLCLDGGETGPFNLELETPINRELGGGLVLMGAGIVFYEEVMGIPFAIRGAGAFTLLGVERIEEEASPEADRETGEVMEPSKTPQDPEQRRAARASALEQMMGWMKTEHYHMVRGMTPTTDHSGHHTSYQEKIEAMGRMLWLRKLEKYRRG